MGKNQVEPAESDSSGLGLPYEDAKALTLDPLNGVEEIDLRGKMAILPGDLEMPQVAVGHLLNARLFYYLPAADGILLSYRNLKVTCRLAATFCDRPFAHVVYGAKAIVFKPRIGQRLRGVVSQLSSIKRHVTCILCGVLNVVIPLDERPQSDASNRELPFRVDDVVCFELTSFTMAPNGTVSLVGRMCDVKDATNAIGSSRKVVMAPKSAARTPKNVIATPVIMQSQRQQQTPTWLNPTAATRQSAQRIYFESSSSEDEDGDSSSEAGSFSETFDDEDDKVSPATPSAKLKAKRQEHVQTPRQVPSNDEMVAAKLEPLSPTHRENASFLFDHHKQSSAKKRKYLAD